MTGAPPRGAGDGAPRRGRDQPAGAPRVDAIPQGEVDAELDAAVRRLLQAAFPGTDEFRRGRHYRHPPRAGDFLILAWAGERLAASVALSFASARTRGVDPLSLAGIGNVCSDPDPTLRGQGHASACLRRAIKIARARDAAAALLFCREELRPYYERLGFREVKNEILLRASETGAPYRRDWHDLRMVLPLACPEWDERLELELDVDSF